MHNRALLPNHEPAATVEGFFFFLLSKGSMQILRDQGLEGMAQVSDSGKCNAVNLLLWHQQGWIRITRLLCGQDPCGTLHK